MTEVKNQPEASGLPSWYWWASGLVVLSWFAWWLFAVQETEPAQMGDAFGPVNALFSAVAFLGLLAAILLQREELKLQREELSATREQVTLQREELERTREVFEAQSGLMELQRFETTFHNLYTELRLANTTVREGCDNLHRIPGQPKNKSERDREYEVGSV